MHQHHPKGAIELVPLDIIHATYESTYGHLSRLFTVWINSQWRYPIQQCLFFCLFQVRRKKNRTFALPGVPQVRSIFESRFSHLKMLRSR
jgi:hypothetical protein